MLSRNIVAFSILTGLAIGAGIASASEELCTSDWDPCLFGNKVWNGSGCHSRMVTVVPPTWQCCHYNEWRCTGTETTFRTRSGWLNDQKCELYPQGYFCPSIHQGLYPQ